MAVAVSGDNRLEHSLRVKVLPQACSAAAAFGAGAFVAEPDHRLRVLAVHAGDREHKVGLPNHAAPSMLKAP